MTPEKRILVVEDFEDSLFSLSKLLEIEGYKVMEATDGSEAVDIAIKSRPDLILMDLTLPVVDGLSATRRIREEEGLSRLPIIAMSGLDYADCQGEVEAAGCTDYLTKPVDFELLIAMISRYLAA